MKKIKQKTVNGDRYELKSREIPGMRKKQYIIYVNGRQFDSVMGRENSIQYFNRVAKDDVSGMDDLVEKAKLF